MFKNSHLLAILIFLLSSCTQKFENKKQLQAFVANESNGLVASKALSHMDIAVSFLPWQTQAYDDSLKKTKLTKTQLKQFSTNYYFLISLSKDQKEILNKLPYNDYSEMVQVLSFRMQNYISIILEDGKTIEPLACMFQPTYGYANANTLLVVFDKSKFKNVHSFEFAVREFGLKTGNMAFVFDTNKIEKISKNRSLPQYEKSI